MHPIAVLLILLSLFAVVFGPAIWVGRVMRKYREPADLYGGTGADLARQLILDLGLEGVAVEQGEPNQDHYDPGTRRIRLSPDHYGGRSLTAITVAAHEVGHAQQHAGAYAPLIWRTRLAQLALVAQKLGAAAILAMPLITLLTRSPVSMTLLIAVGLASMSVAAVVHLVTLPVEWDASFGRALPTLRDGRYIPPTHLPHARRLLTAAALTYLAASLAGLLNLYRWIAILRR